MLTCKEVCAYHAGERKHRLGGWQQFQLILHPLMCGNCRKAVAQIRLMLATVRRRKDPEPTSEQISRWMQAVFKQESGRH